MAQFLKHIGKHGDRKVAVLWRQVPGDDHMCLLVYTEVLNQNIHDPLMSCIESHQAQNADNLADELNRVYTRDGKIILQVLHREGMLKKVQTSNIVMTPAPNTSIRLNELNDLLNEMSKGEAAVQKLAEIDASRGLQDPKDVAKRMRGERTVNLPPAKTAARGDEILGNNDLANNLRTQAARMSTEARGLMAEAERLLKEAAQMEGVPAEKKTRAKKEVIELPPLNMATVEKKRGRPKKVAVSG